MKRWFAVFSLLLLSWLLLGTQSSATCTTGCGPISVATETVPAYRTWTSVSPADFCSEVNRITDAGNNITNLSGCDGASKNWHAQTVHHNFVDQPLDSSGVYLAIQNQLASSPCNRILLDATDNYLPVATGCTPAQGRPDDWRWSNCSGLPHRQLGNRNQCSNDATKLCNSNVDCTGGGTCTDYRFVLFDPLNCTKEQDWTLPIKADQFSSGQGNLLSYCGESNTEFAALHDLSGNVALVNTGIDDSDSCAVTQSADISTSCGLTNCTLTWVKLVLDAPTSDLLLVAHYSGDHLKVFDVETSGSCPYTLTLTPRSLSPSHNGGCAGGTTGEIYQLEHPDVGNNPYDDYAAVIVGNNHCSGKYGTNQSFVEGTEKSGRLIQVDLATGEVHNLLHYKACADGQEYPSPEPSCFPGIEAAQAHHVSMRYDGDLGWVVVSFENASIDVGKRFYNEIASFKLRGPNSTAKLCVARYMHTHSTYLGITPQDDDFEIQAVPARDGNSIIFRGNWDQNCSGGCGTSTNIMTYVVRKAQ